MKQKRYQILITVCFAIIVWNSGCIVGSGFSDTPEISFISITKDTMVQGDAIGDSLNVVISFKDGDGDLGTGASDVFKNFNIIDSRTGAEYAFFRIPDLDIGGSMTGIEGQIDMKFFTSCCILPDTEVRCIPSTTNPIDSFYLTIQMIDDSGKESNIIETPRIFLSCQ